MHPRCLRRDVALRIDQGMKMAAGRQVVDQLQRRDLDQPVAIQRVQAGGLGIEQHRADHGRSPLMKRRRVRKAWWRDSPV